MDVSPSSRGVRGQKTAEMNVSRAVVNRSAQLFYSTPSEIREERVKKFNKIEISRNSFVTIDFSQKCYINKILYYQNSPQISTFSLEIRTVRHLL